ncbi:single-stranded-DNA-specific exonuclease RecJ [candidate division WWE3 bacterium]|uniref:Single-stranded-DNA-specific exonuclease RecJ n=1 Tax=candidate division WWE3 bacterium TaxID=2053526 RepID=A0A955RRD9_UNCKA|nr:single-stranded-DNA-specific exonuclease RecJ [candidate division WWE3 bacterium]
MNVSPKSTIENLSDLSPADRNVAIVEALLINREIPDVDGFLNPPAVDEDFLKKAQALFGDEMVRAVELINNQLLTTDQGSVVIHGDYDVDGVSATAILWETIYYELGYKNVIPFIPHRVDHGYGVSEESINDILQQLTEKGLKPGLLITVDCGITGKKSIEYAKDMGFTVIVTDHHTRPEKDEDLPDAAAILHSYKLCGGGVAWVLSRSLVDGNVRKGVDLAGMATLADIQQLTDFNRSLVIEGLKQLTHTHRLGLQALYDLAGIRGKEIGVYEVGFVIGPRINATGRLEHALDALRLLVVKNIAQAKHLAQKLNSLNYERQAMTKQAVDQAVQLVEDNWDHDSPIVVASSEWHEGIIGLIAGKLTERFKAPSMAITISDEGAKGSARSIEGINVVELLRTQEELFENVGGHAAAAGFSLSTENVDRLKAALSEIKLSQLPAFEAEAAVDADLELSPQYVNWDLYQVLAKLEPFGVGNPRPTFYAKGLRVVEKRVVGKTGDHLSLTFENNLRGIGFNLGEKLDELDEEVEIVYIIDKDDYRGGNNLQLKVKEIG